MMIGFSESFVALVALAVGAGVGSAIFIITSYFPKSHKCTECGFDCRGRP